MAEQLVVVGGKRKEDREGETPAVNTGQKNFLYFDFSFVVEFKQYYIHVEPSDPSCKFYLDYKVFIDSQLRSNLRASHWPVKTVLSIENYSTGCKSSA